jgi:hypothetical protein
MGKFTHSWYGNFWVIVWKMAGLASYFMGLSEIKGGAGWLAGFFFLFDLLVAALPRG